MKSPAAASDGVITFADGLPGFEAHRRFVIVASPGMDPFSCVHGVDAKSPAFLAIDPRRVVNDYACELTPADCARVKAEAGRPLVWLALVTAAEAGATVNLQAPLVINPDTMLGIQVMDARGPYAVNHPLDAV